MYKYVCIVILVLAIKGESSIINLSNKPLIVSNSIYQSESRLKIAWENHITDFIQLIDMQKLMGVAINYMSDEEVLNFIVFLSSMEFKELVIDFESMTEFKKALTYLAAKGYDVYQVIDYIHSALDLPPYEKLSIDVKHRKGITGFIEDVIETLPLEDMRKLFESKLENYPEIANLFETVNSDEFLDIIKRLSQNPKIENYKKIFESYGFDFDEICTLVVKIFGTK